MALLEIRHLTKRYPGALALDSIDLTLETGRIHALVGENGAGKSTLIRILAGVERPDAGSLYLDGRRAELDSPRAARHAGIAVVHQRPHLVPELSVAENLALRYGYPRTAGGTIDWSATRRAAARAGVELLPNLDVTRPAGTLSGAEQTLVELGFALAVQPRLLILDEPTAALPRHESERLFARLRELSAAGGGVLLVTHRLEETFALSQRVIVLRDGRLVGDGPAAETSRDDLIRAMVGRPLELGRRERRPLGETGFVAQGLTDRNGAFRDVDLSIRRGEVYGIYGLLGSGPRALGPALLGLRAASGSARIGELELAGRSPLERVRAGLAYLPSERHSRGSFPQLSIAENLALVDLARSQRPLSDDSSRRCARDAEQLRALRVRARSPDQPLAELSGGNQQKVLLGRWLRGEPELLILEEPTQGVDVGAKQPIHEIVRGMARRGVTVLLVSSELPELLALCDRIGVMREGRLVAEVEATGATEEQLLRLSLPDRHGRISESAPEPETRTPRVIALVRRLARARESALATLLLLLGIALATSVPGFASWDNAGDVLLSNAILLVGALSMTVVIIAGGIDLSIGAILGLAATAAALADGAGWPGWVVAATSLATGAALGVVNGTLSVAGRVHPIVVTLGTLSIFRGAIVQVTGGRMLINLSEAVTWLRDSNLLGLPLLLVASLAALTAVHGFLSHLPSGRRLYALGGSGESAAYLGISPRRTLPLAFAVSGALAGLAGLMWASRFAQVQSNVGQGFELAAIAAAVLGGTHIAGGRGSALGTFLGAMFMGLVTNVLTLTDVSAYWERVIVGGMILLALAVDRLADESREE